VAAAIIVAAGAASFPSFAQAQDQAPGVVPTEEAYLEPPPEDAESLLRRWLPPLTGVRTVRVVLEAAPEEDRSRRRIVHEALLAWSNLPGVPVRFRVVEPNQRHDVVVRWIDQFMTPRAGVTAWDADADGWIRAATVTLAIRHHDGLPMGEDFLRFVALHEFGHLVGLPHSGDPRDVMHPGNRNAHLSSRDVRSAQTLYGFAGTNGGASPGDR
jgi:Matrixin